MNVPAQAAERAGDPGHLGARGAGADAARTWPLPRLVDLLTLGSKELTLLYWAAVGLVAAGFFVTRLLPCVDYPQHLALSDVARRLQIPGAPENAQYQLNYFTYNGLFHVVVAKLSTVMPIELAGRMVVAGSVVATAGAVVALVRILGRPPEYAALFTPILFSYSLVWGFVNYVLATAIAAWALVFVARVVIRPSLPGALAVAALGLLCAFAHVLATLILCLAAAALALELAWRVTPARGPRWARLLRPVPRAALALVPLLVGCVYCIEVYRHQYDWDPNMYRDPTMEGSAPPLWQKLVYFSAFATNLYGDMTDQIVLWASILVMGISTRIAWLARRSGTAEREASRPFVAPFVVLTLAYFATPMVLIGTHLIFPRLAQWTILGAILATPRFPAAMMPRARLWIPRLGLLAGANALLHCAVFAWETRDASATIDDLPAGGAVTAVLWEPDTISFRNGPLTHMAAYYGARKHGRWAFAFARYLSVPVRFRPLAQPAWPARGWEFDGEAYDPRCKYARAFPLVIIKAPDDLPRDASGEPILRKMIFKSDAEAVKLMSHHGPYWAFDTTGLPEDGIF